MEFNTSVPEKCNQPDCSKIFDDKQKLKQHLRRFHKIYSGKPSVQCAFPKCKEMFLRVSEMRNHLVVFHHFQIETELQQFDDLDQFYQWKCKLETDSNERYVKHLGDRFVFYCHRSGFQKLKPQRESEN